MKNLFSVLFLFFSLAPHCFSQDFKNRDTILIAGSAMKGLRFYQHGDNLSMARLTETLKINPEAFSYLKKAKVNNAFSFLLAFAGGFIIGYELGSSIGGKSIDWGIMGGGIGAVALSIPFSIGAKHNAKKAVEIYNAALQ